MQELSAHEPGLRIGGGRTMPIGVLLNKNRMVSRVDGAVQLANAEVASWMDW